MFNYKFLIMRRLKIVLFGLVIFSGVINTQAQEEGRSLVYYIDVLVDGEYNIYVQNKKTEFEYVANEVKNIVYDIPASKYEGVIYRIYGDESLKMGNIIDLGTELIRGYDPLKVERYLLNLEEKNIDGSNYIDKLKKLNLKAIDP